MEGENKSQLIDIAAMESDELRLVWNRTHEELVGRSVERQRKENAEKVGRCYVAIDRTDNENRPMYRKVVGLSEAGRMLVAFIDRTSSGDFEFNVREEWGSLGEEMPALQWNREVSQLLAKTRDDLNRVLHRTPQGNGRRATDN